MRLVKSFRDTRPAVDTAEKVLRREAVRGGAKGGKDAAAPPALVVFDIDDTILNQDLSDETRVVPRGEVLRLLNECVAHGDLVYLVTARENHPEVREYTQAQLRRLGVRGVKAVLFCPRLYRTSTRRVSEFKQKARAKLAKHYKRPVSLSVGDQWTDIIQVPAGDALPELDRKLGGELFHLVRTVGDDSTVWGLKLPDADSKSYSAPAVMLTAGASKASLVVPDYRRRPRTGSA